MPTNKGTNHSARMFKAGAQHRKSQTSKLFLGQQRGVEFFNGSLTCYYQSTEFDVKEKTGSACRLQNAIVTTNLWRLE